MGLMYPKTVKDRSKSRTVHEYVRVVEAYREAGKVKQRVIADLGRRNLFVEVLPELRLLLTGEAHDPAEPSSPKPRPGAGPGRARLVRSVGTQGHPRPIPRARQGLSRSPTAPSC